MPKNKKSISTDPDTVKAGRKKEPERSPILSSQLHSQSSPFVEPESLVGLILVVFEDITNFILQTNGTYIKTEQFPSLTNRILALESELNFTKESLLETSNEKFKTSNEMVQSINEELQSTNEEMETSKEREVSIPGNKWYLVRILPYRTVKDIIDGAIITLIDVTELKRAHEEIQLLQTLTLAISESEDIHTALGVTLRKICETTGWIYGESWIPNSEGTFLECSTEWYSTAPELEKFYTLSRGFTFPHGKGLPGRVWLSGQPAWVTNVTLDANFPRANIALEEGWQSQFSSAKKSLQ